MLHSSLVPVVCSQWDGGVCPRNRLVTTKWVGAQDPGGTLGRPETPSKSQPVSGILPNHVFAPPGTQKAAKTTSKSAPEDPQIANKRKMWDLKKT